MKSNRHIVDQLADVREEKKRLEALETSLKDQILANLPPMSPGESATVPGDENVATISVVESERLDRKAVEALLSKPKFQSCLKPGSSVRVLTTPRRAIAA